jgi:hypothetical protein
VKDAFCTLSNLLLNHSEKIRITLTKDSFVFLMTFTTIFPKKLSAPVKIEDEDLVFSSIRSVFESFGGNVTQIKNHLDHTIIESVYVTVPNYFDSPTLLDKEKDKVALIMEGLENIETITQIFRNVFVNPYVMKNHEDLEKKIDIVQCKIIGSNKCINAIQKAYPDSDCFTLSNSLKEGISVTRHGAEESENFSESFILHTLIKSR